MVGAARCERDADIELTAAAEPYRLGACLRWAWTGAAGADGDTPAHILTNHRRVPLADPHPW
ncbi:hypothetical protein [Streptomyces sp. SID3343]|uniref:hypothetical protein n=1 Tax=Streptomyces sp. SID3343 TaxID=2690260 RepID=UPI001371E00D|nr:hypothetical protein [Streptomyces sp. SID3343]